MKNGGIIGYKPFNKRHIALIFVSNSNDNYADVKFEDIEPIVKDCKKKNKNYKVYFCYLTYDFIKIVKSEYVYEVHIFGHGKVDALGFEDGVFQYRELRHTEPKDFVAQWHCNHGGKIEHSLGYLIGKEYYVPYGIIFTPDIPNKVEKLINGKLKPTKNPNL